MSEAVDAIVVGASHNGLVAACMLAREGLRVTVVEARDGPGGLCASAEFHPGYRHTGIHHDSATIRQAVVDQLSLFDFGLEPRDPPPVLLPFGPDDDPGQGIVLSDEPDACRRELAAVGCADGYEGLMAWVARVKPTLARLNDEPAPPVTGVGDGPVWPLMQQAVTALRLGRALPELTRVVAAAAEDWLCEWLPDPRVRAGVVLPALLGSVHGPRAPQTAALLLRDIALSGAEVVGGPAGLVAVLLRAAQHHGVQVRTSSPVARIDVERGAVQGVTLRSGESLRSPVVVSAADPRRTLLDLVPPLELDPDLEDEIRAHRVRASSAKLHLALSGPPRFSCRDGVFERFRIAASPDEIERAMDAVKHREVATAPVLDARMPTVADPELAPPGHHVLSLHVLGVPASPRDGWSSTAKEQLLDAAIGRIEALAPGFSDRVVAAELLTPPEIEAKYGIAGGHLYHGEHALDQLWIGRPGPRTSGHRTPIRGLFLASGGTHPGGGVQGMPGLLAGRVAREAR